MAYCKTCKNKYFIVMGVDTGGVDACETCQEKSEVEYQQYKGNDNECINNYGQPWPGRRSAPSRGN